MTERENLKEELEKEKKLDDPDKRKIEKLQSRMRTLESESAKAKKVLDDSYLAQKDEEDLAEEEEEDNITNKLRVLRKHKENLIWRKNQELKYFLYEPNFDPTLKHNEIDPSLDLEQQREQKKMRVAKMREDSKKRLKALNNAIQEDDEQERDLERVLGQKRAISDLKAEQLKATRKELTEKMKEAETIANNEDADPQEREIAQQTVTAIDFEIRLIDSELQESSSVSPLREKVKEIFKKYGLTLAGIFAAAGVTIGAIIGVITKALKDMGKKIADGLKTLGQKAASALPGLIGSIVSFLFKTAGQVFGFLAEHTWLLILAVVVFLFEKLMKKQR